MANRGEAVKGLTHHQKGRILARLECALKVFGEYHVIVIVFICKIISMMMINTTIYFKEKHLNKNMIYK